MWDRKGKRKIKEGGGERRGKRSVFCGGGGGGGNGDLSRLVFLSKMLSNATVDKQTEARNIKRYYFRH